MVYAASLAAYAAPTVKRQEIVGGAAIPAYTCDPTKFPSGEAFAVCRLTVPINPNYQSLGGALWSHALVDPSMSVVEPGYKQTGT